MQIESRLKFVFCWSDIRFLAVRSCFWYCCFIYNAFSEALAVKCSRVFFADSYIVCYLELILSFCAVVVSDKNNEKNKTRKRKITWCNPPFNIKVATNVAKRFLALIDKHFPKDKRLSKFFNRNTIKVSYSCLPVVKQTISNNKHRLLQLPTVYVWVILNETI